MCKHIKNVQVSIRAPCCKKWFDCAECHAEKQDHELTKTMEMVFACKKCKKVFRKNMSEYEESDEYCPYCDNHYLIPAKTPEESKRLVIEMEGDERMMIDPRAPRRKHETTSIFDDLDDDLDELDNL